MFCTSCGSHVEDGNAFCTTCGAPVSQGTSASNVCTKCGSALAEGSAFCTSCGTPVSEAAPTDKTTILPQPTAGSTPAPAQQPASTSSSTAEISPTPAAPVSTGEPLPDSAFQPSTVPTPVANPAAVSVSNHFASTQPASTMPVAAPAAAAAVAAPAAAAKQKAPKASKGNGKGNKKVPIIIAAIAVVVIAIAVVVLLNPFELGGAGAGKKNSLNDYSWDEISQISEEIAAANSESAALDIAKDYNLVGSNGKLDGSQVKDIELTDGTKAQVKIVGFTHDEKADKSGKAGITFMFTDAIGERAMNASAQYTGGWETSQARTWLQNEGMNKLPADLRDAIVSVEKLSNNVGNTKSADSVTTTNDKLWLFSAVELGGKVNKNDWPYGDGSVVEVYNEEGSQYTLFKDLNVKTFENNSVFVEREDGQPCVWWQRTAVANVSNEFRCTNDAGNIINRQKANASCGIVPGFCI